jgi:hypothetical protein
MRADRPVGTFMAVMKDMAIMADVRCLTHRPFLLTSWRPQQTPGEVTGWEDVMVGDYLRSIFKSPRRISPFFVGYQHIHGWLF